ncbi:nicotinamide mononucleotide transporter [Aestuariicella sp. G3-2]|uniref:nicotinamide mononucleotide transporter n=1 Tax=Pseudomaricurvus albidus TaxID=2842452 RepID=UPI001C0D9A3C|nr:nicotinamide mononucleotide transporter [Aestuariicella albida]MBU3068696.1 nicotinamide mononucleotide transporter [Aestuariicella albida]
MMDLLLQIWGGLFYLANKILFAVAEGRREPTKKQLRLSGWIIYIFGVPAWVMVLAGEHNWIAASIQAGCVPSMLLGAYNTYHDHKKIHKLFNKIVTLCTYTSLAFGVSYSIHQYGGITSISQILEVGIMLGFLLGSYYMAKNHRAGWLLFALMNLSMAALMLLQAKPILMGQQLVSLGFVIYGFIQSRSLKPQQS